METSKRWPATAARVGFALLLVGCAGLAFLHQVGYRGWEAWCAGRLAALLTGSPAVVSRPLTSFFLEMNTTHGFGMRVTGECTSAIVTIGACMITAVLTLATRIPMHRLLVAALAAAAAFYVLNIIRLVGIALATRRWGLGSGYHWSHVWAGSFVTVLGGIGVSALYLMLLGLRRRSHASDTSA